MITTTLARVKKHNQYIWNNGFNKLARIYADDAPLPYSKILRASDVETALWLTWVEPQHRRVWQLLTVRYARNVQQAAQWPESVLTMINIAERMAMAPNLETPYVSPWERLVGRYLYPDADPVCRDLYAVACWADRMHSNQPLQAAQFLAAVGGPE